MPWGDKTAISAAGGILSCVLCYALDWEDKRRYTIGQVMVLAASVGCLLALYVSVVHLSLWDDVMFSEFTRPVSLYTIVYYDSLLGRSRVCSVFGRVPADIHLSYEACTPDGVGGGKRCVAQPGQASAARTGVFCKHVYKSRRRRARPGRSTPGSCSADLSWSFDLFPVADCGGRHVFGARRSSPTPNAQATVGPRPPYAARFPPGPLRQPMPGPPRRRDRRGSAASAANRRTARGTLGNNREAWLNPKQLRQTSRASPDRPRRTSTAARIFRQFGSCGARMRHSARTSSASAGRSAA